LTRKKAVVAEEVEAVVVAEVNMVLHQHMFQHSYSNHRHSIHMKNIHSLRKKAVVAEEVEAVAYIQRMQQ
jgi:hypothetical protein